MAKEDDRPVQGQLVEGAGQLEGRLNEEFIEWLKKWGGLVLLGVAAVAGLYAGYQYLEREKAKANDASWMSFNAAATAQRPETLVQIAGEAAKGTAVGIVSPLVAADIHLAASRTGIPIGEKLDQSGKLPEGKAFLTDEQRASERDKAEALYRQALSASNTTFGQAPLAISALTGLAAIAEDRSKNDEAKGFYQQAIDRATAAKFDDLAKALQARKDSVDQLGKVTLISADKLPGAVVNPVTVPMGNFMGTTTTGQQIQIPQPGAVPAVVPAPDATPAPAPAPTPAPGEQPKP
ncbi:MAG: tetratricopeptide repeat protein [Phycisphaerales bacterium]|nr:tetratricopeptide repeat protein [Phycisphaerales bacterium]